VNLRNSISQTCVANNRNEVVFNFTGGKGNVNFQRVNVDQVINSSITECAQRVFSSNSSMQKSSQTADQTAKATTKGLSLGDLLGLLLPIAIAVGVVIILLGGAMAKGMGKAGSLIGKLLLFLLALFFVAGSVIGSIVLFVKSQKFPNVFVYHSVNVDRMAGGNATLVKEMPGVVTLKACGQACMDEGAANIFVWMPPDAATVRNSTATLQDLTGSCSLYSMPEDKIPKAEDYERKLDDNGNALPNPNRLEVPYPCDADAQGLPIIPPLPSGLPS
jgi:hypothetical protein